MTYRNPTLLELCREAPCCLQLGAPGCGTNASVACHSDMIRHGRGEHHKSHDCFAVPGCPACHEAWKRSNLGKEGYHAAWVEAMERYILWLWVSGNIILTARKLPPKEHTMEAPLCRICDHRHWAREPHQLPANAPAEVRSKNTPREGRRVVKAEAARPDATRTASTERPDPPPATQNNGKRAGRAAKPSPGKRKLRTKKAGRG